MRWKRRGAFFLCLLMTFLGCAFMGARADETGVLSEKELNGWLEELLRSTLSQQPGNAPVGEESLTEDGYAFLYGQATLFYDKPQLDQYSKLQAVSVTDDSLVTPRGIAIGSPAQMLIDTYGWQNPGLLTDGFMAPFYVLNQLPQAAYWAWAQVEDDRVDMVNCYIHVQVDQDVYTDAGIQYTLEDGLISGIRVYGLGSLISLEDVLGNLEAYGQTQTAISGDSIPAQ
ncbi:MAG: hypothetical protein GXY67_06770 [Clostridiales bacterium]|nr:hypothetical protein [Clostridiales bacterium]